MPNLPIKISVGAPSLAALDPQVIQALLIAGLVFVMAVLLGFSRHYLTSSSLRSMWAGFVVGILAVLFLEAGIYLGIRSFVFGEKAAQLPENIRIALTQSSKSLAQVLGIQTERQRPTAQSLVSDYSLLTPLDAQLVKNSICRETEKNSDGGRSQQ